VVLCANTGRAPRSPRANKKQNKKKAIHRISRMLPDSVLCDSVQPLFEKDGSKVHEE
jgi:hypothetical protein